MNRRDLKILTDLRIVDAKILLDGRHFSGAYYLVGYAVECALKDCIAKQIKEHDIPDKQLVLDSYTHNLEKLLRISGVKLMFDSLIKTHQSFEVNWNIVKDWPEGSPYDNNVSEVKN